MKKERSVLGFSSSVGQVNWILICILIITILFALGFYSTTQMLSDYYEENANHFYLTSGLKKALSQSDEAMAEYLRTGNRASLIRYNDSVRQFQRDYDTLVQTSATPQEQSLLRSISDSFYSYQVSSNFAAFSYYEKEMLRCYDSLEEAHSISRYLTGYCDELLDAQIHTSHASSKLLRQVQNRSLFLNVAFVLFLSGMSLLGIHTLIESFQRPLNRLYQASLDVSKGNYTTQIPENYRDSTMEQLSCTFNRMTQSIHNMVQKLEEKKELETRLLNEELKNTQYEYLLEQANFLALQSQANPHFLFNTLNSISRTITLNRSDDAVMMIDALTILLRYNLQDATIPATLAEELHVVAQYMTIQGYRFQDRIKAYFNYDKELTSQVRMPRFTLQPIVENAIIHGLEPKMSPGSLWITVTYPEQFCQIDIRDDGVGIDPQKLQKLLEGTSEGRIGHTTSIGINNTRKRLEIFTHQKDSFCIENHPDGGTLVRIRIPFYQETTED